MNADEIRDAFAMAGETQRRRIGRIRQRRKIATAVFPAAVQFLMECQKRGELHADMNEQNMARVAVAMADALIDALKEPHR